MGCPQKLTSAGRMDIFNRRQSPYKAISKKLNVYTKGNYNHKNWDR
jgi:hypothetical protein